MEQYRQRARDIARVGYAGGFSGQPFNSEHAEENRKAVAEDILTLALDLATEIVGEMEEPMPVDDFARTDYELKILWHDRRIRDALRESQLSAIQEMRDQLIKEGKYKGDFAPPEIVQLISENIDDLFEEPTMAKQDPDWIDIEPFKSNTELAVAFKEWIAQGRSEEQVYGVANFFTGRGGRWLREA